MTFATIVHGRRSPARFRDRAHEAARCLLERVGTAKRIDAARPSQPSCRLCRDRRRRTDRWDIAEIPRCVDTRRRAPRFSAGPCRSTETLTVRSKRERVGSSALSRLALRLRTGAVTNRQETLMRRFVLSAALLLSATITAVGCAPASIDGEVERRRRPAVRDEHGLRGQRAHAGRRLRSRRRVLLLQQRVRSRREADEHEGPTACAASPAARTSRASSTTSTSTRRTTSRATTGRRTR